MILKKTKEWQKIYPQYNFISFSFILMKNWRFNDYNDWFKLQKIYEVGPIFCTLIRYSLIPLQKAHRLQCEAPVFLFFSISMAPWMWHGKRCDWFCNDILNTLNEKTSMNTLETVLILQWFKKEKNNNSIKLKFKREGFLCTEYELVTSNCLV